MRVIGLAGWSGAGKTTLLTRLIPVLARRGVSVSTLKHAHHGFDLDHPGKDSHAHREAGARQVLIASERRWALMTELGETPRPSLAELIGRLSPVDLVLIEGFKREAYRKIEVYRAASGKPPLHPGDDSIVAIASDAPLPDAGRPVLALDDVEAIATAGLALAETPEATTARLGRSC